LVFHCLKRLPRVLDLHQCVSDGLAEWGVVVTDSVRMHTERGHLSAQVVHVPKGCGHQLQKPFGVGGFAHCWWYADFSMRTCFTCSSAALTLSSAPIAWLIAPLISSAPAVCPTSATTWPRRSSNRPMTACASPCGTCSASAPSC